MTLPDILWVKHGERGHVDQVAVGSGNLRISGIKGVIFDLEGTLVGCQWDLAGEVELRAAFSGLGFAKEALGTRTYATMWNWAVTLPGAPADEATLRARIGPIYDRWDADALSRWQPRPGAAEVLARLAASGHLVGMATTVGRAAQRAAAERFGFAPYLDPIVTRDDVRLLKPEPECVRRCLDAWGISPDEALMVGDSRGDTGAARRAGVRVAILAGGETPRRAFADDPPDVFLESLTDLEALLSGEEATRARAVNRESAPSAPE